MQLPTAASAAAALSGQQARSRELGHSSCCMHTHTTHALALGCHSQDVAGAVPGEQGGPSGAPGLPLEAQAGQHVGVHAIVCSRGSAADRSHMRWRLQSNATPVVLVVLVAQEAHCCFCSTPLLPCCPACLSSPGQAAVEKITPGCPPLAGQDRCGSLQRTCQAEQHRSLHRHLQLFDLTRAEISQRLHDSPAQGSARAFTVRLCARDGALGAEQQRAICRKGASKKVGNVEK